MNKYCLTFDVDWAPDFILQELLRILDRFKVKATFFLTHKTKLLDGLDNIEKGIHPYILDIREAENEIDRLKQMYPEAISSRAHSLYDSGRINRILSKKGIKIKSNYLLYLQDNIKISRMPYTFELHEVPIYFIDGNYLFMHEGTSNFSITDLSLSSPGLKVINFHPIHIYLNTKEHSHYEKAKGYINDKDKINQYVNVTSRGIKKLFLDILDFFKKEKVITYKLKELVYE